MGPSCHMGCQQGFQQASPLTLVDLFHDGGLRRLPLLPPQLAWRRGVGGHPPLVLDGEHDVLEADVVLLDEADGPSASPLSDVRSGGLVLELAVGDHEAMRDLPSPLSPLPSIPGYYQGRWLRGVPVLRRPDRRVLL